MEEFLRAGVDIDLNKRKFVDVQTIFHKMEQRTLAAAYKFITIKSWKCTLGQKPTPMQLTRCLRRSLTDILGWRTISKHLSEFSSFNTDVDFAGRMVYNDKGEEVFNFGKYKVNVWKMCLKRPGVLWLDDAGRFSFEHKESSYRD